MKKLFLTGILLSAFLIGCKSTTNTDTATTTSISPKANRLKGDWSLSHIIHNNKISVKPFDEGVGSKCFEGSVWKLIPNNFKGSYSLNTNNECPSTKQNISFYVTKTGEFMFKKIQEGTKMKQNTVGYSLRLENQTDISFDLVQEVPFDGKIEKITYKFEKLN